MRLRLSAALIPAFLISALLGGCNGVQGVGDAPAKLAPIQYEYIYAMGTFSQHMRISEDGEMEVAQVKGNGPGDRRAVRTQLTPEQKSEILAAFRGWKDLKEYYPAFFGPVISITFGGRKVEGADTDTAPAELKKVRTVLDKVAQEAFDAANAGAATRPGQSIAQ